MGNNKNTIITPPETPKSTGTHDHTLGTKLSSYFLVQRRASDFGEVSPPSERSASDRLTKSPERIAEERQQDLRPQVDHNGSVPSPASNNQRVLEWNDSNTRVASPSTFDSGRSHPADPPRPPREGLEWVWFPEGYWAEREIRVTPAAQQEKRPKWWNIAVDRTSSSARKNETSEGSEFSRMRFGNLIPRKGSSNKSTLHVSPGTSSRSPRSSVNDYDSRRNSHPPNIRSPSHNPPGERSPDEEPLGLYCRTKKTIKSRFMQNTVVVSLPFLTQSQADSSQDGQFLRPSNERKKIGVSNHCTARRDVVVFRPGPTRSLCDVEYGRDISNTIGAKCRNSPTVWSCTVASQKLS